MSEDKLSDEEMEIAMKGLHDVWDSISPTPKQIDHDIIGELSRLRQKVAVLEDNKKFYEDIAKDISKRLNEAEDKLESIEEQFLHFIELRKIKGNG